MFLLPKRLLYIHVESTFQEGNYLVNWCLSSKQIAPTTICSNQGSCRRSYKTTAKTARYCESKVFQGLDLHWIQMPSTTAGSNRVPQGLWREAGRGGHIAAPSLARCVLVDVVSKSVVPTRHSCFSLKLAILHYN